MRKSDFFEENRGRVRLYEDTIIRGYGDVFWGWGIVETGRVYIPFVVNMGHRHSAGRKAGRTSFFPDVPVTLTGNAYTKTLFLTDRHKQIEPMLEDF